MLWDHSMKGGVMENLFDPTRITPVDHVPEFFYHGPRHMELLSGDIVRIWLCRDQPIGARGMKPMSIPVATLVTPLACYVWNTVAYTEWAFDRGLLLTPAQGPTELRPRRALMM